MKIVLESKKDAYRFLERLGAPKRLLTHVKLVGEAAEILIQTLLRLQVPFDTHFIRLGVILHDAGKILYPEEFLQKGNQHEPAGEAFLLENGVAKELARVCLSHARWSEMECSLEELLIALADTLWKGKRCRELEEMVLQNIATILQVDPFTLFVNLDTCFETIAMDGPVRLERSLFE